MAIYKSIDALEQAFADKLNNVVPRILAETATEYFKDSFRKKEWNGIPWQQTKQPVQRGSLMLRSSKLMNSIRPSLVSSTHVRISAGSSKVPYAKTHNQGTPVHPKVTPKMRQWAWAQYRNSGKEFYKNLALTKKHRLTINMPKRQFMGHTNELNNQIKTRITGVLNTL